MNRNLYAQLASRFPADRSRPAFTMLDGAQLSYAELEAGAGRLATLLKARGVSPGDRVAVQAPKSLEAVMLYLAVLKVVGFVPSQLRRTVAWQASVIAIASLLVGVPLGIVVGRWVWLAFTRELGVIPEVSLQPGLLVLLIVVVLLVANLIALVPARTAARTPVARIFRA